MDMGDMHAWLARCNGPSVVPGLSVKDVIGGTIGMGKNGHSLYADDQEKEPRLKEHALHGRVDMLLWKHSQKELKVLAKQAGARISGNKKVLALRLALKGLPANLPTAAVQLQPGCWSKPATTTAKRKAATQPGERDAASSKKKAKRVTAKSLGLTKEEFARIKLAPHKKSLNGLVEELALMVNADWHDGWFVQGEHIMEWGEALRAPMQAVLDIGVGKVSALSHCNEILKFAADSYKDLCACPMRGGVEESASEIKVTPCNIPGHGTGLSLGPRPWEEVWTVLLRSHANKKSVDEALLLQCIKDAHDNGVDFSAVDEEGRLVSGEDAGPDGAALKKVVEEKKAEWQALPSFLKEHKMRRRIDRRFDGELSRRTRDYRLYRVDDGW